MVITRFGLNGDDGARKIFFTAHQSLYRTCS
jgi:hypothetical protein